MTNYRAFYPCGFWGDIDAASLVDAMGYSLGGKTPCKAIRAEWASPRAIRALDVLIAGGVIRVHEVRDRHGKLTILPFLYDAAGAKVRGVGAGTLSALRDHIPGMIAGVFHNGVAWRGGVYRTPATTALRAA